MSHPEQLQSQPEISRETIDAAERQAERLASAEKSVEQSPEQQAERVEQARHETEALFSREAGSERKGTESHNLSRAIKRVTDQERKAAYIATMQRIRSEMSSPAQAFSKFIHNGGVEKASSMIGQSIARPNAVLSGSTCALLLVSIVYVIAKVFGYPLSGFETIGAFVLGWAIGLIYDYARILITGRS